MSELQRPFLLTKAQIDELDAANPEFLDRVTNNGQEELLFFGQPVKIIPSFRDRCFSLAEQVGTYAQKPPEVFTEVTAWMFSRPTIGPSLVFAYRLVCKYF